MPTKRPRREPRNVAAIVYDDLCTFEFGIVSEVFGLKRPELDREWYSFRAVSVGGSTLNAAGGIRVSATGTPHDLRRAGTVIVPGWRGKDVPVPKSVQRAVIDAHAAGARLVSICSGAYVLAAAGLLDGRRATTHWQYAEDLSRKYPQVKVEADRLYVDEDNIFTSAGSSAGIDLCLHIVRMDYGAEIANRVARRLVMHAHRQGGQAQFIDQPMPIDYGAGRLSETIDYIRTHLDQPHSVGSLAQQARMSSRTFQRRFAALTGLPVGRWLVQERVTRACELLESSTSSLEEISAAVGATGVANLQYHFRKLIGMSPGRYRTRFSKLR